MTHSDEVVDVKLAIAQSNESAISGWRRNSCRFGNDG